MAKTPKEPKKTKEPKTSKTPKAAKKADAATNCILLTVRTKQATRWRGGIQFTPKAKTIVVKDLNNPYQGDESDVQFVSLELAKRIYRDKELVIVNAQSTELLEG